MTASRLEVSCPHELSRGASELLTELGCVAFDERPDGQILAYAATEAELLELGRALQERLGTGIVCRVVALSDDWKLAFSRSLEPLELTPTLWIEPTGSRTRAPTVRRLQLEPAFAFGFGEHPTTRMLARWLERTLESRPGASVLDFGCGTGILSLAAAAFGASHVVGLDIDPEAIRAAQQNAALNHASTQCAFSCEPLGSLDRDFDVVVANVGVETLVGAAPQLVTRMSRRGVLALTGFLMETAANVAGAVEGCGVRASTIERDGEWALVSSDPVLY